jgi:hypothetical protein
MTTVLATNAYKAAKEVKITKPSPLPVLNHALLTTEAGWLVITTAELTDDGIKAKRAKIAAIANAALDQRISRIEKQLAAQREAYPAAKAV